MWCSTTGGTRQMAEAAELGARCAPGPDDRVNGRPWALLVCAGSDGTCTIRQAERIATGPRLRRVADPVLVITYAQTPEAILAPKTIGEEELARCERAGALLGAGLAAGIF